MPHNTEIARRFGYQALVSSGQGAGQTIGSASS